MKDGVLVKTSTGLSAFCFLMFFVFEIVRHGQYSFGFYELLLFETCFGLVWEWCGIGVDVHATGSFSMSLGIV